MRIETPSLRSRIAAEKRLPGLVAAILFAIAYAQSPLYTSNQNQYFLHAAARAGLGTLNQDWLANTQDPTPLFSAAIYVVYRLIGWSPIFYLLYALLMGVYLVSLIGIVRLTVGGGRSRLEKVAYLAALIGLHSAGLRFFLSRTLGAGWTYVLEDGVADQRLLGPVLQPSAFGVFLMLSILLYLQQKPSLAVLSAALAASFHPTYLLPAALLCLGYGWSELQATASNDLPFWKRLWPPLRLGLLAFLAVSPILLYTYLNFGVTPPETTAQAQAILVHVRIPHHALIATWFDATVVFRLGLILAALWSIRRTRLFSIFTIALLGSFVLTLIQAATGSLMLALIFPWRISALLVPLSTALLAAWGVHWLVQSVDKQPEKEARLLAFSLAVIGLSVLVGGLRFGLDLQRKAHSEERAVQAAVARTHTPTDLYLVPSKMQDFRLEAQAPIYVDFKSIPYADQDVLEWNRRQQIVTSFYKNGECERLPGLIAEGVNRVVMPDDSPARACPGLIPVWEGSPYSLYRPQSLP